MECTYENEVKLSKVQLSEEITDVNKVRTGNNL